MSLLPALLAALLALSVASVGQAAPPSSLAGTAVVCKMAADCQHNGVCTGAGACHCSPGWSGNACGTLAVAPAAPANGLRQIYPNGSWASSWGGSIRRGGGAHYLLAAEITNECPVKQYLTNSRAALAVSHMGAAGPYTRLRTAIPVEAHNIQTVELPDGSVVLTTAAVLQAPQFLFKVERGDEDLKRHGILPLSDWEMASRLSYFLWDSVPDPQLFAAAEAGELTTEAGIREQVQRMLADPKAHDAMIRFHQQWLQLDGLYTIAPARSAYGPSFGLTDTPPLDTTGDGERPSVIGPLRHALDAEFQLFVSHVVFDSDGTLKELFTSTRGYASSASDIIHIDSTPADGDSVIWSYGNVVNSGGLEQNMTLTPVTYPSDQRSGILTLPAVNAVGAYPVHPDPIHRGLRVLERVACMDLGAPPASAESASPADIPEAESTNRFRTENATSPSNCQGCHVQINPPGFAFENYDSLGAWRTQDPRPSWSCHKQSGTPHQTLIYSSY